MSSDESSVPHGHHSCSHARWDNIIVEMLRDGAEAVNLDRCTECGQYRLSWWWPKDSADTTLQSSMLISNHSGRKFQLLANWNARKKLFENLAKRK